MRPAHQRPRGDAAAEAVSEPCRSPRSLGQSRRAVRRGQAVLGIAYRSRVMHVPAADGAHHTTGVRAKRLTPGQDDCAHSVAMAARVCSTSPADKGGIASRGTATIRRPRRSSAIATGAGSISLFPSFQRTSIGDAPRYSGRRHRAGRQDVWRAEPAACARFTRTIQVGVVEDLGRSNFAARAMRQRRPHQV